MNFSKSLVIKKGVGFEGFLFRHFLGTGLCLRRIIFLYGSWGSYTTYKNVRNYQGRAVGHITNKYFQLGSDGGGNYYVAYWFMASPGNKITASSIIAKQQWDILRVDDTFEIRFDLSNPKRNIPMYGGSPSFCFCFFYAGHGRGVYNFWRITSFL